MFWLKDGKIVTDATGHPTDCDHCPCGGCTCVTSIAPTGSCFSSAGGTGTITVSAPFDCDWTATASDGHIVIDSGSSGTGDGTVDYTVDSGGPYSGSITICGQVFYITQTSGGACSFTIFAQVDFVSSGSFEQIVSVTSNFPEQVCLCNDGFLSIIAQSTGTIAAGVSNGAPVGVNVITRTYVNGVLQGCACVGDGTNQCFAIASGVTCNSTSGPLLVPVVPGDVITFDFRLGTPGVSGCTPIESPTSVTENSTSTDCPTC